MPAEVFLDTAYAIALSSPNDQFHTRSLALAEQLEASGTRLVTTRAVLLEIVRVGVTEALLIPFRLLLGRVVR